MISRRIQAVLLTLTIIFLSGQCGTNKSPPSSPTIPYDPAVDTIPPAAIKDLLAKNPTANGVFLMWTAPGDDGHDGTATSYDVRFHNESITEQNWENATQFDGEPAPKPGGQLETIKVGGLDPVTTYFFAIKTTDDKGNVSGLSNPASMTTQQESVPPSCVTDLSAVAVDDYSFLLTWTATGDDGSQGTASLYQIRYSSQPISAGTWSSAIKVPESPNPKPGGEPETLLVSSVRRLSSSYFAMKVSDEVPNWSELSNVAYAMGYSVLLETSNDTVYVGNQLRISFRAPGGDLISLHLNQYGIWGCDPTHPWVVDCIIPGVRYPEGVHEILYDFNTPQGGYLPRGTYYVVLCWQFQVKSSRYVVFMGVP